MARAHARQVHVDYRLREIFPDRTNIERAPFLGDLALRYAVDIDAYDSFLPLRGYAGDEFAPTDAPHPPLSNDRVTLGDLLVDGGAGGVEGLTEFLLRALEVLTGRPFRE